MWTASCFFEGTGISNPYYWFDIMLTVTVPVFIPIIRLEIKTQTAPVKNRNKWEVAE